MLLLKSMINHDRSMVPSLGIIAPPPTGFITGEKDEKDPTSATQQLPLLSLRIRVLNTQILAYMLDSLVRVSRRVDENHFVSIPNMCHRLAFHFTSPPTETQALLSPSLIRRPIRHQDKVHTVLIQNSSLSSVLGMKSTLGKYNRCIVTRKLRALPLDPVFFHS